MSVAVHCGVLLTLRRLGNLAAYEGDCGPEERSSGGMDESDGCWAAIVSKTRRGEQFREPLCPSPVHNRAGHTNSKRVDYVRNKIKY